MFTWNRIEDWRLWTAPPPPALTVLKCAHENGEEKGRSDYSEQGEIDVIILIRPDAASREFRPSARKPPWTIHVLPRFDLLQKLS
jgi:hypothetical protein